MKRAVSTLAAVAVSVVAAPAAWACIHAETEDPQPPYLDALELGVYFDGTSQTLTYAPSITATGDSTRLAMVTATPSIPASYSVGSTSLFATIRQYLTPQSGGVDGPVDGGVRGDASDGSNGFEELPTVAVGPYTFTAFQVTGDGGLEALNARLAEDGFVAIDAAIGQVYADEGWYFIAIAADSADATLTDGLLPPVQVTFSATTPVVPLRLEAGMPPFAANIYAAMPEPVDADLVGTFGVQVRESVTVSQSEIGDILCGLKGVAPEDTADCAEGLSDDTWTLTWLQSDGNLNAPSDPISAWDSEFKLLPGDDGGGATDEGSAEAGCTAAGAATSGWLALGAFAVAALGRRRRQGDRA